MSEKKSVKYYIAGAFVKCWKRSSVPQGRNIYLMKKLPKFNSDTVLLAVSEFFAEIY